MKLWFISILFFCCNFFCNGPPQTWRKDGFVRSRSSVNTPQEILIGPRVAHSARPLAGLATRCLSPMAVNYQRSYALPEMETPVRRPREEVRRRSKLVQQQKMHDQMLAEEKARERFLARAERRRIMCASQVLMEDSDYRRERLRMQEEMLELRHALQRERSKRRALKASKSEGELMTLAPARQRVVLFADGDDTDAVSRPPPPPPPLPPAQREASGVSPSGVRHRMHRVPSLPRLPLESPQPRCGRHAPITQPRVQKQDMASASLQQAGSDAALSLCWSYGA